LDKREAFLYQKLDSCFKELREHQTGCSQFAEFNSNSALELESAGALELALEKRLMYNQFK
jgi:hypothetical protein